MFPKDCLLSKVHGHTARRIKEGEKGKISSEFGFAWRSRIVVVVSPTDFDKFLFPRRFPIIFGPSFPFSVFLLFFFPSPLSLLDIPKREPAQLG